MEEKEIASIEKVTMQTVTSVMMARLIGVLGVDLSSLIPALAMR